MATCQEAADGHWRIAEAPSAGDQVVVRWTGYGTHLGEIDGVPATGSATPVHVLCVHRMSDGKIAQTCAVGTP